MVKVRKAQRLGWAFLFAYLCVGFQKLFIRVNCFFYIETLDAFYCFGDMPCSTVENLPDLIRTIIKFPKLQKCITHIIVLGLIEIVLLDLQDCPGIQEASIVISIHFFFVGLLVLLVDLRCDSLNQFFTDSSEFVFGTPVRAPGFVASATVEEIVLGNGTVFIDCRLQDL